MLHPLTTLDWSFHTSLDGNAGARIKGTPTELAQRQLNSALPIGEPFGRGECGDSDRATRPRHFFHADQSPEVARLGFDLSQLLRQILQAVDQDMNDRLVALQDAVG